MVLQPAAYQIANYNIYPGPKILLNKPLNDDCTVTATLVEVTSRVELTGSELAFWMLNSCRGIPIKDCLSS